MDKSFLVGSIYSESDMNSFMFNPLDEWHQGRF